MSQMNYSTNQNYSGVYTQKEKNWLSILRYGGLLLFGIGIYGFVTHKFSVAISIAAIVAAVILTTINVRIMQVGIVRRKELSKKQAKRNRRVQ